MSIVEMLENFWKSHCVMEIAVEYCLNITFYITLRVPAAAEKAEADMAHSACGWNAGCAGKMCYPLTMRAIPERLRDPSRGGTIQIDDLYLYATIISEVDKFTHYFPVSSFFRMSFAKNY